MTSSDPKTGKPQKGGCCPLGTTPTPGSDQEPDSCKGGEKCGNNAVHIGFICCGDKNGNSWECPKDYSTCGSGLMNRCVPKRK
jgi:hypothetical protein